MIGTGKSFEFANYGAMTINTSRYVPNNINIVEICSMEHPVKLLIALNTMYNVDFTTPQQVAVVNIDGTDYPITISVVDHILRVTCDKTFVVQIFYGKDNYT